MSDMDASRIRELLLDFYTENDPYRLNMGLDVFSMVVWTQQNGLEALNDLLYDQYGKVIDPTKQLGGAGASFKRFSTLMATDSANEAALRNRIYNVLVEFYEDRDPSKIGRLNDFVQYIMLHGLSAFNRKLRAKYNDEIVLQEEDARATYRKPRVSTALSDDTGSVFTVGTLQRSASSENFDEDEPPPPPLDDLSAIKADPEGAEALRAKLKGYYAFYDPGKLDHVDAIVDWGLQIGEEELEGKLIQVYGAGFNKQDKQDRPRSERKRSSVRHSIGSALSKMTSGSKSSSTRSVSESKDETDGAPPPIPPLPSPEEVNKKKAPFAPNKKSGRAPPQRPQVPKQIKNKALVDTIARESEDGPCSQYRLDMTGDSFGVCKCGYSRIAHMKGSQANAAPTRIPAKKQVGQSYGDSRQLQRAPSNGFMGTAHPYTPTYLHLARSDSPTKDVRIDARAHAGEGSALEPCTYFVLDMNASFGVCKCGFRRDQHVGYGGSSSHGGGFGAAVKRVSKKLWNR